MNINYNISTIAKAINGKVNKEYDTQIKNVFVDSRIYFDKKTSVFFALKGKQHNGHKFIEELYKKGLKCFVVENNYENDKLKNAIFIKVKDTLKALQELAIFHKNKFNLPIIAITGSNGKTTIKEWLYHYLRNYYNIIRSPKSYNSQVGVPLSILQINKEHNLAIIEAGISLPKEIEKLEKIIKPDLGILTNINKYGSKNFKSYEELKLEKQKLFKSTKWFYSYENNFDKNSNIKISDVNINNDSTSFVVIFTNKKYNFTIPFNDKASIENSITCIRFLLKFGIPINHILEKSKTLPKIAFRLESQKGINNNTIIRDNYNSNITTLNIALDYLERFDYKNKIVILTDVLQDKINTKKLYKQIAELINKRNLTQFIGIGYNITKYKELFEKGKFYNKIETFINNFEPNKIKDTCILIKGNYLFELNKINNILIQKSHQTTLEINLSSLSKNIKCFKEKLNPNTKIMGMVKAFGYGAGSKEICTTLQHSKIDYFGVAYTDEGVYLRNNKINTPILVMNMEEYSFEDIVKYNLEPSIYCLEQLENFIKFLIDKKIRSYPVHIKLDTGMHRLGFLDYDIKKLIDTIINQPEIYIKGIFSHLSDSDNYTECIFTLNQIEKFKLNSNKIEKQIGYKSIKHILNSSGIEQYTQNQFQMVRLGIGMYGISKKEKLEVVCTLKTKISQIKVVKSGSYIGYGKSYFADKDTIIGVIPIGYADGFKRELSNGIGSVFIKGKMAPIIGRVSMDMTMINISDIIDVKIGDEVEIFGKNRPIESFAKQLNTIPYEILTSISSRVVRTYIEE